MQKSCVHFVSPLAFAPPIFFRFLIPIIRIGFTRSASVGAHGAGFAPRGPGDTMKRFFQRLLPTACATLALTALASTAEARATKGKFGIGGMRALSGYSALQAKYFITRELALMGGLGFTVFNLKGDDDNNVGFVLAPGVAYYLTPKGQSGPITASFGLGARLGIFMGSRHTPDSSFSGLNTEILGIAEVFLGRNFSLAPEVGLVFRFVNEPPDPSGIPFEGFGFSIGENTGLFGGGSFNFYF